MLIFFVQIKSITTPKFVNVLKVFLIVKFNFLKLAVKTLQWSLSGSIARGLRVKKGQIFTRRTKASNFFCG